MICSCVTPLIEPIRTSPTPLRPRSAMNAEQVNNNIHQMHSLVGQYPGLINDPMAEIHGVDPIMLLKRQQLGKKDWDEKVKHHQSSLKQLVRATSGRLLLKNCLEGGSFDDDVPAGPGPGPMLTTLDRRRRQLAGGTDGNPGLANVDRSKDENETMPAPMLRAKRTTRSTNCSDDDASMPAPLLRAKRTTDSMSGPDDAASLPAPLMRAKRTADKQQTSCRVSLGSPRFHEAEADGEGLDGATPPMMRTSAFEPRDWETRASFPHSPMVQKFSRGDPSRSIDTSDQDHEPLDSSTSARRRRRQKRSMKRRELQASPWGQPLRPLNRPRARSDGSTSSGRLPGFSSGEVDDGRL